MATVDVITSKAALRILHLEDNRLDAELVQETLRSGGFRCQITRVTTREDFQRALASTKFDLILADYSLPSFDGVSALMIARDLVPHLPFIFVSATLGEDVAIETLKTGARDYVSKHRLLRLVPAVKRALRETEEQGKAERAEQALLNSERRFRFLADASAIFASSLDFRATLASVARLAVPQQADWCGVYLVEQGWSCTPLVVVHRDTALSARIEPRLSQQHIDPTTCDGNPGVASTGQAMLVGDYREHTRVVNTGGEPQFDLLAELGTRSFMAVPLLVRGQTIGIFVFGMSDAERRFSPADLALADDLGRRAAVAIENSRLFDEAQEAIRVRDEFLSIASHELKTPLTSLQLEVQVLLHLSRKAASAPAVPAIAAHSNDPHCAQPSSESGAHKPPTLEYVASKLEIVERQSKKLSSLVNALLDVSRITGGRFEINREEVDLARVVKDVLTRFSQQITLSGSPVKFCAKSPVIGLWDRLRLEQVATNLIANALKYGRGKPVEVTVEALPQRARLQVRDFGIGIALENQNRIFGRFERAASSRNYGGLGLGLYIVKQIIDVMNGSINVVSEPGQGSTFIVELPRN